MNYFSLVSILPTVLETKKENTFSPVVLETGEKQIKQHAEVLNITPICDPEKTGNYKLETEGLINQINELNQKNEYLSSNLIETNSHLLSIYKRIRHLENETKEVGRIKKENVFFFQKVKRIQEENV